VTEISQRYARLADAFAAKIAAVPPDRWESPSPCEDWTARDVVRHVVGTQGLFLKLVGRSMPDHPSVDDDPAAAWDAARAVILADLEDPGRASVEYDGAFGRSTFEAAVDRFLSTDLVVHGWDLARAAGLDDRIDPHDVERVRRDAELFGDAMRSPQAFGPALEPPPDADEQTRLLAFLGRRA
jgi:uncharacterized protein (TIGR03086 family)